MKVLIAAGIYPPDPGGPAVHAKAQFEGFPKHGIETELVAFSHYRKWLKWVRHFLFLCALFGTALKTKIIYAHDAWGVGFPALLVARLTGNKLVLRIGGDMAWEREGERKKASMLEWYEHGEHRRSTFFKLSRIVLRSVDAIVVPSVILKDVYTRYYGVNERKITVIGNPVSHHRSMQLVTEETIIYASRLVGYKNLDFVLRALKSVLARHPELKFLIMGDGPKRGRLESLARELEIGHRVIFTGTVPQAEVIEQTKKCRLVLAPALTEFYPNYVLQGITYGKPFLISREQGISSSISSELQFDPRDPHDFQNKLEGLLTSEGYERARQEVERFSGLTWDKNLEANITLLKQLLNGST